MNCDNHKPDITTYSKEYYKNNKAYFKEYYKKYYQEYKNSKIFLLTCEGIIKINKTPITLYFN